MAARGSEAKTAITNQILKTFYKSFSFNGGKEIRIPYVENGEVIEIKVTLTAAKDNVGSVTVSDLSAFNAADDVKATTALYTGNAPSDSTPSSYEPENVPLTEPSEEELDRLEKLLKSF